LKIEEDEEYDEDDDGLDDEDDEDYYAQPENLEAKASKILTTTEVPEETTSRGKKEDTTIKIFTMKSPTQKQVATLVNPDQNNVRLVQTQNGRTIKYPPTYETKADLKISESGKTNKNTISEGFDSIDNQDITISKTTQKIKYKTRYLPSKPSSDTKNSAENAEKSKKMLKPDSYVSVTNSVTGSVDENNQENGKFASTYFTKSSTCGHFTFSCNIVYGSEGRSRICRPKQTNPKCR
jgi:hypothetical protein